MHDGLRVAVLLSGERRTFDEIRSGLESNLLRHLGNATTVFDCSDAWTKPLSLPGREVVDMRGRSSAWSWPSSAVEVLIQFERNHLCWARIRTLYERGFRFDAVVRTRPDMALLQPLRIAELLTQLQMRSASRRPGILLSRARCWPDGKLPRHAWTFGHTRCGGEALSDDAFFVVAGHEDADDTFSRPDSDLLDHVARPEDPSSYPRCNTSFKASIVAECIFTRHLLRRGIRFLPTSFAVGLARLSSDGMVTFEGHGSRPPARATPIIETALAKEACPGRTADAVASVPRVFACATADRKGVCRVALPFVVELLEHFLSERCHRNPTRKGISPMAAPLHVMVGCDNAPALSFSHALHSSPDCLRRFRAHESAWNSSQSRFRPCSGQPNLPLLAQSDLLRAPRPPHPPRPPQLAAHRLAVMVLKEPRSLSERFYGRGSWGLERILTSDRGDLVHALPNISPVHAEARSDAASEASHPLDATLMVDAFGSLSSHKLAATAPVLTVPWAAVSYPSRGRAPSELYWPATTEAAKPFASSRATGAGGRICAFMGRRSNPWRLAPSQLWRMVPGYMRRDALVRLLNCTHLTPADRNAVRWMRGGQMYGSIGVDGRGTTTQSHDPDDHDNAHTEWVKMMLNAAEGPTQIGPFEGTRPHYNGTRFVLAVENVDDGSPISEKLVNAFLAGAVPIGWGGGSIHRSVFNPASFVDCSHPSLDTRAHLETETAGAQACAALVRAVDGNATRFNAMLAAPRFASRVAFERFFAWSDVARGSNAQRELHAELAARLRLLDERICSTSA